jgi:hypothetical protein
MTLNRVVAVLTPRVFAPLAGLGTVEQVLEFCGAFGWHARNPWG